MMLDAQKLLGSLLSQGLGRKGGLGGKAALGMGALGIAVAAYEHFSQARNEQASPPPTPGAGGATPPPATVPRGAAPPPPPPGTARQSAAPPPPPGTTAATDAAPRPPAAAAPQAPGVTSNDDGNAVLLVRAMIAAANADGTIDASEQAAIIGRLVDAGLGKEEREFVLQELATPPALEDLLEDVSTPELARQFYAVSLLAIDVDTERERGYLATLAERLGLPGETVRQIHAGLEKA